MKLKLWLVIFFAFSVSLINAARILAIFPIGSKSHFISALPIVETLAEKGHEVTLLSPFQLDKSSTRQVHMRDWADLMEEYKMDFFAMHKENSFTQMATLFIQWSSINKIMYDSLMGHPEIQNVIKERNVDLLFIDGYSELPLPLADLLQVPVVGHYSSAGLMSLFNKMGISSDFASIPSGLTDFTTEMSFFQRVANTISATMFTAVMDYFFTGTIDHIHKQHYPIARSVFDMAKDMSLVLVNSHPTTAWQRPLPPNVIPIGSVHTRPGKPLEHNFQSFADEAHNGFIVFSLGSMVPISSMPDELLQSFMKVFTKLQQKIIMKWETDELPPNMPANVMTTKWLPQQDLIGHHNALLLIGHGGLIGLNEAIYHAIPVIGIPFGNDQRTNLAKAQKEGYVLKLDWDEITEHVLQGAILKVLNEPSFKENASRVSRLVKDELVPSVDVSVYWVEHVLRHKGAKHLQLASRNMPFYEKYLLDVVFFLLTLATVVAFVLFAIVRFVLFRICFGSKSVKVKKQ